MNPYLNDRLKSDKGTNFLGFIDDFRKLWEAAGKLGNVTRIYQKDDMDEYPIITYRMAGRKPHESFKEKKPRFRSTIEHPYRPGEYVEIYGQVYQVFVEFAVYSASDEEADQIAVDLEEFINNYKGFFKKQGVKEIYFKEQSGDVTDTSTHFPIAKRTLTFDMQFEAIIPKYLNQIEQLAIQARIFNKTNNNGEES